MDWMCRIDWQALAGFANATVILLVALFAGSKFDDWKRQFQYRKRAEIAERVLLAVYEAEQALSDVRSPLSSAQERQSATENLASSQSNPRHLYGRIIWDRIAAQRNKWEAIIAELAAVRFAFGEAAEQALRKILDQVNAVRISAEIYGEIEEGEKEFVSRLEKSIWIRQDDDEISASVYAARTELEKIFHEYT